MENRIEKLNNDNYHLWKLKMRAVLVKEKLWVAIENPGEATAQQESESFSQILLNISDDQFVLIKNSQTGNEAWSSLKNHHLRCSSSNKVRLLTNIFTMKLAPGGSMEDRLLKMEQEFAKLAIRVANGESIGIEGKGMVRVNIKVNGNDKLEVCLNDVFYSPLLDCNLVSVQKLAEKGFIEIFSENFCKLKRKEGDKEEVVIATLKNGMYELTEFMHGNSHKASTVGLCVQYTNGI